MSIQIVHNTNGRVSDDVTRRIGPLDFISRKEQSPPKYLRKKPKHFKLSVKKPKHLKTTWTGYNTQNFISKLLISLSFFAF